MTTELADLDFASVGARHFRGALRPCINALEMALAQLPQDKAGLRLHGIEPLGPLLGSDGCIGAVAASQMGALAKPVRAILFNKSPETNWSLA